MALSTFSAFYFLGDKIDTTNQNIDFDEGGGELTAVVAAGSYTITEFAAAIKAAMDTAGGQVYTVSLDRDTRVLTISAAGSFTLRVTTGTNIATSPWSLMGFTANQTGTSLVGDSTAGEVYYNQFVLQDYVSKDDNEQLVDANVNESTAGEFEVIDFGTREFYEFSLRWITNKAGDGKVIKNNPTGLADVRNFLSKIIGKAPFEYMPDRDTRATFDKVVLESIGSDRTGLSYKLSEEPNLPDYFNVRGIRLRVIS